MWAQYVQGKFRQVQYFAEVIKVKLSTNSFMGSLCNLGPEHLYLKVTKVKEKDEPQTLFVSIFTDERGKNRTV